jgi:hypothetical protein
VTGLEKRPPLKYGTTARPKTSRVLIRRKSSPGVARRRGAALALVEQRREVVLGQEADVLREHREDALERELHDVALALRVLLLEASVQLGHEVGDFAETFETLTICGVARAPTPSPKEGKASLYLGRSSIGNGEPGRRAVRARS